MNVEDEDFAALQSGEPKLAAVVSETAMMRLVPPLDRITVNDFPVAWRPGLHVHNDQLVRSVAEPLHPESPDIDEFFLSFDARKVG
jgi:hypothetical protein